MKKPSEKKYQILEGKELESWLEFVKKEGYGLQAKLSRIMGRTTTSVNLWFRKNTFPVVVKLYQENMELKQENEKLEKERSIILEQYSKAINNNK